MMTNLIPRAPTGFFIMLLTTLAGMGITAIATLTMPLFTRTETGTYIWLFVMIILILMVAIAGTWVRREAGKKLIV